VQGGLAVPVVELEALDESPVEQGGLDGAYFLDRVSIEYMS
jgi:hypothetical protein